MDVHAPSRGPCLPPAPENPGRYGTVTPLSLRLPQGLQEQEAGSIMPKRAMRRKGPAQSLPGKADGSRPPR
jgi:hypothetical protein